MVWRKVIIITLLLFALATPLAARANAAYIMATDRFVYDPYVIDLARDVLYKNFFFKDYIFFQYLGDYYLIISDITLKDHIFTFSDNYQIFSITKDSSSNAYMLQDVTSFVSLMDYNVIFDDSDYLYSNLSFFPDLIEKEVIYAYCCTLLLAVALCCYLCRSVFVFCLRRKD